MAVVKRRPVRDADRRKSARDLVRRAGPVLGAVVLLGLVAVASSAGGLGGNVGRSASKAAPPVPRFPFDVGELVLVLLAGGVAGGGAVLVGGLGLFRRRRKKKDEEDLVPFRPRSAWWAAPLAALLAAMVTALALVVVLHAAGGRSGSTRASLGPESAPGGGIVASSPGAGSPAADWLPLVFLAGGALAAILLSVAFRTRGRRVPMQLRSPQVRSIEVVGAAIDDLRVDPDPRRAVIRAYARMEHEFARGGWPRRPSRAPFEYLEEALARLKVPSAPTRALTELFEVARFSDRRVDPSMRDRAIDALAQIRRALVGSGVR
jgi:hypothetical protein